MKDILSYKQLFNELTALNTSAYDFLLREDLDGFQNSVQTFIDSGIMEQEKFPAARAAYRYSSMPFTLNHMWIGPDAQNMLNDYILYCIAEGWTIHDLNQRDVYPVYAYMARRLGPDPLALTEEEKEQERQERLENKLVQKRLNAFDDYIKLYEHLYDPVDNQICNFSFPLIHDATAYQLKYMNRVSALAEARSRFHLTFNFNCTTVNHTDLTNCSTAKRIKILTDRLPNLYENGTNKINPHIKDYLTFGSFDEKIIASNYLQGKNIPRKNWKNYCKGKLPNQSLFYLELAFYLNIPSSNEIEKFMNLHGYSIKSPMTVFFDHLLLSNNTPMFCILHKDLCQWIDAGIDYNIINEICGFVLQEKEVRKQ